MFDLYHAQKEEGKSYRKSFILWPKQWQQFSWNKPLIWDSVPAKKSEIAKLPTTPGVYVFVITYDLGNIDFNGFIAYIGETKGSTQSLRSRCEKYFLKSEHNKRPHIGEMMHLWPDNLRLYYTSTSTKEAQQLEGELLKAILPPYNRKFPGEFNAIANNIYHS